MTEEIADVLLNTHEEDWHYNVLHQQVERIEEMLKRYLRVVRQRVQEYSQQSQQPETDAALLQMDMLARFQTKIPACDIALCRQSFREADRANIPADSRLGMLIARFGLDPFERDALLLTLMPLANSNAGLLFACLQHDAQDNGIKPELILNLLCRNNIDRLEMEVRLSGAAPLVQHALVQTSGPDRSQNGWSYSLHGSPHIFRYLCGRDSSLGQASCRWLEAPAQGDLFPELTQQLLMSMRNPCSGLLVSLSGGTEGVRKMALAHAASTAGCKLLVFDMAQAPEEEYPFRLCFVEALREATLYASCLVLPGLHDAWERYPTLQNWINDRLVAHTFPLFGLIQPDTPLTPLVGISQVTLEMPKSTPQDDTRLLISLLKPYQLEPDVDPSMLVRRFRPASDTLLQSLSDADAYRRLRGAAGLSAEDLNKAFRQRSQQAFGGLATRIEPKRTFADLIISEGLGRQLEEVLVAARFREEVLARGFEQKIAYGTGISALFHGDSGTGKTLVAEVLAATLGVDMIKIDLATVVDKYIGETEKHLARVFDAAERDSGLLFFDEADALFGKRSETRDSHDRYANIEISYLLQRLESYSGLVILATNNRSHLDDAFTRRINFIIRFPFPDAALRERMWQAIWPAEVTVAEEVDFSALARRAEITGANIRNIALLASWLAAEQQAPYVGQKHIDRALQRELAKMGRVV
ncbi:AAA family ATPase [Kosakonia sp. BK9b]